MRGLEVFVAGEVVVVVVDVVVVLGEVAVVRVTPARSRGDEE